MLLYKTLELLRSMPVVEHEQTIPVYHPRRDPRMYEITRDNNKWNIRGEAIERAAAMTYWENDESMRRFQRILEALGIDEDLRKSGVREGDMVVIGKYELEWKD